MSREAKIERRRLVARRVFEALCAAERAYHIEQRRPTADHDEPSTISTTGAAMRLAPVWSMLVTVGNRARVSFDQ
jgi:flagellar biosynthesis regulator FlbT